jgi:transcriptional regulator with XRE-family HTH domain
LRLEHIAQALNVPLGELFYFSGEMADKEKEELLSHLIIMLKDRDAGDIKLISEVAARMFREEGS